MMSHQNLHDAFKKHNPEKVDFIYIDLQKRASHSRIDVWVIYWRLNPKL